MLALTVHKNGQLSTTVRQGRGRPTLTADTHDILPFADLCKHRIVSLAQCNLSFVNDLLRPTNQGVRDVKGALDVPMGQ